MTVIGGGAAGAMAALSARKKGARVRIRSRAWGATALSSGAVDLAGDPAEVAGDAWGGRPSVERNLAEMTRRNPHHPLGKVGALAAQALEAFCAEVPLYRSRPLTSPNLVLPTDLGTWKSTFLAQRTQTAGDLPGLAGKSVAVVGLRGWPLFRPPFLAESLSAWARRGGVDLEVVPCVAAWPDEETALREPHELARALDAPGQAERLGQALASVIGRGRDLVLLPPILGLQSIDVADRVSRAAGVCVAEPLASELSVPGLRLQMALDRALDRAGIERDVSTDPPVGSTVLATGRFLGGGIVRGNAGLREALFGLRAFTSVRAEAFHTDVAGPHAFMSAGVLADDRLRPVGGPSGLHAAGAVLGGYDPVRERCGLGTAILTGYAAGAHAAGET